MQATDWRCMQCLPPYPNTHALTYSPFTFFAHAKDEREEKNRRIRTENRKIKINEKHSVQMKIYLLPKFMCLNRTEFPNIIFSTHFFFIHFYFRLPFVCVCVHVAVSVSGRLVRIGRATEAFPKSMGLCGNSRRGRRKTDSLFPFHWIARDETLTRRQWRVPDLFNCLQTQI